MNEYGSLATYQLVHLGEAIAPALRLRLLDDTAADPLADEEPVAGGSHRGFGARAHRHRGTHGSAPATGPERSGHRGAYGALVLRFARLFGCMRRRGSWAGTGGDSNAYAAT